VLGVFGLAAVALMLPAGSGAHDARRALGLRLVATGLNQPVYVTAPASEPGRLYVVERRGVIRVLVNGVLRAQPFLDIQTLVGSAGGEQGLFSVAFSPAYATNRLLYVDYTDRNGDTRVVEYRSDGTVALPSTARELLFVDQPYANHNGGQLQFGPDGKLYVGMGDGGPATSFPSGWITRAVANPTGVITLAAKPKLRSSLPLAS
jgi:glucose/arabinose dehydrogenase